MITVAFSPQQLQDLRGRIWDSEVESAAILLARPTRHSDGSGWRLIVQEVHVASDADYLQRTAVNVTLDPRFCLPLERRARTGEFALVYCHTHVHAGRPHFSPIDDAAERELRTYLDQRGPPERPHVALLLSEDHATARLLGGPEPVRCVSVGPTVEVLTEGPLLDGAVDAEIHNRQVLAFGAAGQTRVAAQKVAVVGAGGTGSLIIQQLAHLGVRDFLLVDPDTVALTNLNRLVGGEIGDVDVTPKVEVARRAILRVQPQAQVTALQADITEHGIGRRVADMDFIFSCTDSHASRHLINQLSYQYRIPAIDVGVAITADDAQAVRFNGHVKMLAEGEPCLWCVNHLNAGQVRQELMNAAQRAADPYVQGGDGVAQPAVISLNGVVASLAVTMFLAAVAGVPSQPRYLAYDGNRGRVNGLAARPDPTCIFCGSDSSAGGGDAFPLPERALAPG